MKRLSQGRRVIILRDDHIGDTLGAIFLDPSPQHEDWIIGLLRNYLGHRVRIVKIDLMADHAELDVEVQAFADEAARLVAAAADLRAKGAPRNALELFRQALELDPLSQSAALGTGLLLGELERPGEALVMLRRARESGPENADVLYAMGQAALRLERIASAIVYLERAFELSPGHFAARRALTDLGRRPTSAQRSRSSGRTTPSTERSRR
jgi:tetratricopeptide (TPR) repeat protein